MFLEASRQKLRFSTGKGGVTVEDLWDLPLTELNRIAVALSKQLKESKEVNFLDESSKEDTRTKLEFDVVIKVLETKKEESKIRRTAASRKKEQEKILALIEQKEEAALGDLSVDDLKKMAAELAG